jgi:hypothetical protein
MMASERPEAAAPAEPGFTLVQRLTRPGVIDVAAAQQQYARTAHWLQARAQLSRRWSARAASAPEAAEGEPLALAAQLPRVGLEADGGADRAETAESGSAGRLVAALPGAAASGVPPAAASWGSLQLQRRLEPGVIQTRDWVERSVVQRAAGVASGGLEARLLARGGVSGEARLLQSEGVPAVSDGAAPVFASVAASLSRASGAGLGGAGAEGARSSPALKLAAALAGADAVRAARVALTPAADGGAALDGPGAALIVSRRSASAVGVDAGANAPRSSVGAALAAPTEPELRRATVRRATAEPPRAPAGLPVRALGAAASASWVHSPEGSVEVEGPVVAEGFVAGRGESALSVARASLFVGAAPRAPRDAVASRALPLGPGAGAGAARALASGRVARASVGVESGGLAAIGSPLVGVLPMVASAGAGQSESLGGALEPLPAAPIDVRALQLQAPRRGHGVVARSLAAAPALPAAVVAYVEPLPAGTASAEASAAGALPRGPLPMASEGAAPASTAAPAPGAGRTWAAASPPPAPTAGALPPLLLQRSVQVRAAERGSGLGANGALVQRSADLPAAPSSDVGADRSPAALAPAAEGPRVDVQQLARQVSRILVRQLEIERERRGGQRWP